MSLMYNMFANASNTVYDTHMGFLGGTQSPPPT